MSTKRYTTVKQIYELLSTRYLASDTYNLVHYDRRLREFSLIKKYLCPRSDLFEVVLVEVPLPLYYTHWNIRPVGVPIRPDIADGDLSSIVDRLLLVDLPDEHRAVLLGVVMGMSDKSLRWKEIMTR